MDFSVILAHRVPKSTQVIRLRRYNGKSHEHTNGIEKQTFPCDFHIHQATERYQDGSGFREDAWAEPTNLYADFSGAIQCMLRDCGFVIPRDPQGRLFAEEV